MKRLFTEEDYKRHNYKSSQREIKKRQQLYKNKKNHSGYQASNKPEKKRRSRILPSYKISDKLRNAKQRHTINVPRIFSITEATDENLLIFNEIFHCIRDAKRIYLNMESIEIITPDALLYILSIFEYFDLRNIEMNIKGNFPKNERALELLIQSDFFKYVSSVKVPESSENVLQIKSGFKTDSFTVREVVNFALKHLKQKITPKSKIIYRILIEMMGNTVEHAYRISSNTSRWYLMACRDDENGKIRFAFLDGGLGMPATIRKNFGDKVREVLSTMTGVSTDSALIMSALQGKFRTRTNKGYRGKGLPNIYKSYKYDKIIENLKIISNVGCIDQGNECMIKDKFHGTLYTWEFI